MSAGSALADFRLLPLVRLATFVAASAAPRCPQWLPAVAFHGLRLLLLLRTASLNLWLLSSGTLLHPRLPLFSQFLFLPILLLTLLLPIAARYSLTGRR